MAFLLVLGAAASFALAMRWNARVARRVNILRASFIEESFAAFLLLPYLFYTPSNYMQQLQALDSAQWGGVIVVLGIGGAVSTYAYFNMLKHLGPERSAFVSYAVPVISGGFFYAAAQSAPSISYLVGSGLILFALLLTHWRKDAAVTAGAED
ncbi:MAG: EamA family transporter [Sedimenticola sp.]